MLLPPRFTPLNIRVLPNSSLKFEPSIYIVFSSKFIPDQSSYYSEFILSITLSAVFIPSIADDIIPPA